ncbi:MAG TPA: hypothetical protein VK206_27965 [Anaerolineales bacterium]|nr:hypothetical protein [Anaerolineales bacterium]
MRSVQFTLGSLDVGGTLTGLGGYPEGVTATLTASGIPVVSCTNQGGNESPGQNPSRVSASGIQLIPNQDITKKGTAPLDVSAIPEPITAKEGGCPNNNWTAEVVFVYWTNATITIFDTATNTVLLQQNYDCITTRYPPSVSCTPVP